MAVCIAVIGKDNSPQFIACSKPDLELQFHYKVHTSLDIVEEKLSSLASSEIRKLYLGLLHSTEEHKIYGYATNTKIKFIIVVETSNTSLRDNDIQTIFQKLHSTYVDIVSNPFYIPGDLLESNIRGLSTGETLGRTQFVNASEDVNLNAGIDILENYQVAWAELHELAQENAVKAQEVDNLIGKLHKKLQKQSKDISQMGTVIIRLPEVIHSVNELMERIASLDDLFVTVEKTLIQFENLMEIRELQDRQLDHRFQLALYKEKKLSMLENFREKLAEEHAEKLRKHELKQHRIMKERQQAFDDQFKQDVKVYKETNTISKINTIMDANKLLENDKDNTLEDVKLEPEDYNALDEFLNDSVQNPS